MFMVNHLIGFGSFSAEEGLGNSWSIDLSGSSQYGTASTGPGALPITLFAWIYPDAVASRPIFRFAAHTAHTGSLGIMFDSGGKLQYHQPGTVSSTVAGATSTGAWQSIAVAAANAATSTSNPVFYSNGAAVGGTNTVSGSGTPTLSSSDMALGKDGTNGSQFDGKFAMLAIWSKQLAADEIAEIHNAGASVELMEDFGNYASSADLLYHWAIEEGSGTTLVDQKGAANITLVGTPTWSSAVP